jgi:hypothetical protein
VLGETERATHFPAGAGRHRVDRNELLAGILLERLQAGSTSEAKALERPTPPPAPANR